MKENTNENSDNIAAIGIGAMIVFIALILVAAVAAAVIIQTAEQLQQNAQTTGEETTDLLASKIFIKSVITTGATDPATSILVTFELAPGSDEIQAGDVMWAIVCGAQGSEGDFTGASEVGQAGASATLETGATYSITLALAGHHPIAGPSSIALLLPTRQCPCANRWEPSRVGRHVPPC